MAVLEGGDGQSLSGGRMSNQFTLILIRLRDFAACSVAAGYRPKIRWRRSTLKEISHASKRRTWSADLIQHTVR